MNVDQTIQVLSKMVKKTPLTQKLLSKPPFRYLHDLVSEMMKNTGLFVGLFDEREMNHENVKEKDAKIQYLQKLVDAVTALGQETKLNPLKVVAGYEPEETNAFLQLLGELALQKVNTQDAVKRVLSKQERPDSKQSRGSKSDLTQTRSESKPEKVEAKPEREVKSEKVDQKPEKVEAKVEKVEQKQEKVEHKTEKAEQKPEKVEKHERSDSKHDKPERQEKPEKHDKPDRQEKHDRLEKADAKESHSRTASKKEEEEQLEPEEAPPAEEPQPVRSRMRPVTARHAPPKPKKEQAPVQEPIKQQVAILSDGQHKGEDDDEFVVKVAETKQETTVNGQEQHGGLVKKILQSKKEDEPQKPKKQTGVKEIEELQEAIQKLCQSTNPLGKTMDYIQEDVDAMNKEFELWRRECQSLTLQAQEQSRITTETLAPLEMQLKQVEDLIEEQLDKISAEKASIFQNDATIQKLLSSMSFARK
ncbi:microtubule-binding protein MIP-T3-domain-containing protein [Gorgonomyces haynaldii]|nr:microtubule-binding protein MIP-T3-domain-containing protein [Gorgonomyces haynaldii]